jgi:predicted nucleic acid-binding protein
MSPGVSGNVLHDAHIAALCVEQGVSELLTDDHDVSRFPRLFASAGTYT